MAYAARALGVKATIVIPSTAAKVKMEATRALGAEIVMVGPASNERIARAAELERERKLVPVPPYNDEKIIAGQGTIGLEIMEDLPEANVVLVPVGGGGLISGIATAIKESRPGHGATVGNLWSVCQTMGKDIAATTADGERTHAFEKPTFVLTGSSVFPRIKITSVSLGVRIDHRQAIVRCRMSNFGQWVLRDIKSGKSHWFAATPSAQALLGDKRRSPSLGQDLQGFTSSGP